MCIDIELPIGNLTNVKSHINIFIRNKQLFKKNKDNYFMNLTEVLIRKIIFFPFNKI